MLSNILKMFFTFYAERPFFYGTRVIGGLERQFLFLSCVVLLHFYVLLIAIKSGDEIISIGLFRCRCRNQFLRKRNRKAKIVIRLKFMAKKSYF